MQTMTIRNRRPAERRKLTIRLSEEAWEAAGEAVELGLARNRNAFIEDAIRLRARETRHARMRKLAAEAMADPAFVADMRESMRVFERADREGWPESSPTPQGAPKAGRRKARA